MNKTYQQPQNDSTYTRKHPEILFLKHFQAHKAICSHTIRFMIWTGLKHTTSQFIYNGFRLLCRSFDRIGYDKKMNQEHLPSSHP